MEFHRNMFELHQKANPKEMIVGWCVFLHLLKLTDSVRYATGKEVNENSVLIHEFFQAETISGLGN